MKNGTKSLFPIILCALCTATLAVTSQISIPTPFGIPLTLQVFFVCLIGFILGVKKALATVFLYVFMGAIGLPVFFGLRGGISAIIGEVTGGFILGFIPLALCCGLASTLRWSKGGKSYSIALSLFGLILCHVCGVALYSAVTHIDIISAFSVASLPFILKDAILLICAFFVSPKIISAVNKSGYKL